jgi:hypothetical protein
MKTARYSLVPLVAGILLATAAPAAAQATRTWVSGVGADDNPCSRTAPCKTWAGAIFKTAAGGEINALDPGGYGAVTITKSITLDGGETFASTLAAAVNGVIVNAAPTDRVVLRRLSINGVRHTAGPGINGIRYLGGASLHVENCVIANFNNLGIDAQAPGTLVVADTVVRNAGAGAIKVAPTSGAARVVLERSRLTESGFGLQILGNVVGTTHETTASLNLGPGFWADGGAAELHVDGGVSTHNDTGVLASNGAAVHTNGLALVANTMGALVPQTGGEITPFSGTLITGNPAGASTAICEVGAATPIVNCVDGSCPTPSCPAPIVQTTLGQCKKCKTKNGQTRCTGCPVQLQ